MPHSVVRKVLVPENINLLQLHFVIRKAMGWKLSHVFQFQDRRYKPNLIAGIPNDSEEDYVLALESIEKVQPANLVSLESLMGTELKSFLYRCDLGDDWWHRISFQKVLRKELVSYQGGVQCIEGQGTCPPDGVGGPLGYRGLLKAIQDIKHPDYMKCRKRVGLKSGQEYDTEVLDLEAVNENLMQLYQSEDWTLSVGDYFNEFCIGSD